MIAQSSIEKEGCTLWTSMWRLAPPQLWLWKRNVPFECEDQGLEGWMSLSQESIVNFYALLLLFSDKLIFFLFTVEM